MSEEVELKYDVEDLDAMAAHLDEAFPPADDGAWREQLVTDRYIDTTTFDLARAGYGARLRRADGQTTLNLKSDARVEGPRHSRSEIEGPGGPRLDPATWPSSEASALVLRLAGDRAIVERFSLRQQRRERTVHASEGSVVLSLDRVRIVSSGRVVGRLSGLEVELSAGRRRVLREVAEKVAASGLVQSQPLSKMELASGVIAARTPIAPDDAWAEAGRKVLARHLLRVLDRQAPALGGDPLAIKQMRVATRRLRSVWRVFEGAFRRPQQRRHLAELRRTARRLGAVRDLDVLLGQLPDDEGLRSLAEHWRRERSDALVKLVEHLGSERYQRFTADHLRLIGTPSLAVSHAVGHALVVDLSGQRVRLAHERLLEAAAAAAGADLETLHALRIAVKRLRYTLETFHDLLPSAPYDRCRARLIQAQDRLGALNDAAVALEQAERWLRTSDESAAHGPAVNRYIAVHQRALAQAPRAAAAVRRTLLARQMERDLRALTDP